ncbi:DUF342 domain-containing protein [Paenibacillus thailandensis]|uniref:DUF342 domain-containing protein n=1 Tax=Paenibacillus thailandensis TaxID=393250 RepID=A0ABW5QX62_9BACL
MDDQLLESHLRIQTSPDKLSAFLLFNYITDEFACTPEQLERFIRSKGIVHGLQSQAIHNICRDPVVYSKEQTLIAVGDDAKPGADGQIRFLYDMEQKERRPAETQDGKVDFKEISQLRNVKSGQLIAERVDPKLGPPGKTVTGELIPPKPGKPARFKPGKNVVVNPEQTGIYSTIDGLVTLTDKDKINVFPVYEVNGDVDYRVGNIDFVGTVVIRGNVLSGFKVKAAGDIRVVGGVEGAEIESEGSIEITSGIMAGNKGYVKAGRNIRSSFIQDANVIAGEEVEVSQSIMHSNVRAGKRINCTGAKGLIVGGTIQAGESVTARTIGNTMSTATVVEVGVLPELRGELIEQRMLVKQLKESMDKTDKALVILDQLAAADKLTPEKMNMRMQLLATKRQASTRIDSAMERILEIEQELENTDKAKVSVLNVIYGGTKVVIGRYTKFIKDPLKRILLQYADGEVAASPYVG